MKEWLFFLPYIDRDVGVSHYRCLCFLNAASVAHTDTPLCQEALETHTNTHTHRSLWYYCLHVCLELKCAPWLVQSLARCAELHTHRHTLSLPCRHTHTQACTHTRTKGGWKATSERSVPWWPWIFPFVFRNSAPSEGGSADFTCKCTHKTHPPHL